ncbi:Galactomannan galactosyltransferase 1-like protein [Drosera capensis]
MIWNSLNSSPASNHCTKLIDRVNCSGGKKGDPKCMTFYDDPTMSCSIEKKMDNWDYKRRQWLKYHPSFFKNKVDHCRIHGYQIFYNSALLQPKMSDYWAKIPAITAAMMAHPEAEWIFWIDSDAAFTDMNFKIPLKRYEDNNLVFNGCRSLIFEKPGSTVSHNLDIST